MISSGNTRSAAYNDQRGSATVGARPRVPSSRLGGQAHARPDSREELFPHDSASNAPYRRTASDALRANGSSQITSEPQTERIRFATRENFRVYEQNPVKETLGKDVHERAQKDIESPRVSSWAARNSPLATSKKKEALRELNTSVRKSMF